MYMDCNLPLTLVNFHILLNIKSKILNVNNYRHKMNQSLHYLKKHTSIINLHFIC